MACELASHVGVTTACNVSRLPRSTCYRKHPVKAKSTALLMADLGVTKSHSRPHVSDDNPFSESQFKTLKYRPEFPDRFGSVQDARTFCAAFFTRYNTEHHHSGIAMMTPEMVHYGLANQVQENREQVLHAVYAAHPERFVRGIPSPRPLPEAVWIIPPRAEIPCDRRDGTYTEDLNTILRTVDHLYLST